MGVQETAKTVVLTTESGASAEIYLYGASVTSWKVDGEEKLFVSSKASLDGSKPIRGGIPICYPIFGPPPSSPPEYAALSQHGFVRSQNWTLDKVIMDRDEGVSVRFLAPAPIPEFKHDYKLAYVVTLSRHELSTDIHVTNTGSEDFIFQSLLHTYLAVPDASKISIEGMSEGVTYIDKVDGAKNKTWDGSAISITQELDAVFHKVPGQELKLKYGNGKGLNVRFRGFEDTTIWNPSQGKGSTIGDMEDGGWERYVCIEPGYVREFKTLKPGEEFLGQQVLRAE